MMGADYNDTKWEDVLNQLTVDDLLELTRQGRPGAMTVALPSTTAIDGPAGFGSGKYITDYTQLNSSEKTTTSESCIAWPAEVVVADMWNVELCEEMGKAVGEEGLWGGGVGWYGPAANIHRTPYSGRNHEYYSEDGFLSGETAEAVIHGAVGKGLIIYIKHCVLNDMELHREGLCTFANEQAIREIYLKAFQAPCTPGENDACANGNMREAAHRVLYNFANSAAMNGLAPTDKVVTVRTWYQNALLTLTIVTAVVFAGSALMALAQAYLPKKKDEKEAK